MATKHIDSPELYKFRLMKAPRCKAFDVLRHQSYLPCLFERLQQVLAMVFPWFASVSGEHVFLE